MCICVYLGREEVAIKDFGCGVNEVSGQISDNHGVI